MKPSPSDSARFTASAHGGGGLVYGSVCSGIEAASVAWHPLGWRASFLSEIEAFPRSVLTHHYPETPLHGDFTTIKAGEYEPIDLLVGGTPCQSFSVAGLRGGLDDDRGNLALEYLRLADRLRPRWLVWENVPGVLSSNGGRDFGSILGGMGELGYGIAYRVLDAQFFGVAQRRRRVFVVGYLGDWRRAAAVLFERHSLSGDRPPRRDPGQGITPVFAHGAVGSNGAGIGREGDPSFTLATDAAAAIAIQAGALRTNPDVGPDGVGVQEGVAYTLEARSEVQAVAYGLRNDAGRSGKAKTPSVDASGRSRLRDAGFNPLEEMAPTLDTGAPHAVAFALRGRTGGAMPEVEGGGDRVGSLRAASGGSSRDYVAFSLTPASGKDGGISALELPIANTLTGTAEAAKNGRGTHLVSASAVRRLTPRECERLQGFPDDYTAVPHRGKPAADGPRYKALGNSMAVPVMAWIGQRIQAVEALVANDTTARAV